MSLLDCVQDALSRMDGRYTSLSRLRFDGLSLDIVEELKKQKIQERPFAYEFYHQFRKFWDDPQQCPDILRPFVIQGEVNKSYQDIPHLQKCPDFLIHLPGHPEQQYQVAVIEFKLATNLGDLRYDLEKLVAFGAVLNYQWLIEVLIGEPQDLAHALEAAQLLAANSHGEHCRNIHIVGFETRNRSTIVIPVQFNASL